MNKIYVPGMLEIIVLLLDKGIAIDAKNRSGKTALMIAVTRPSSLEIVRLLIKRGADVNIKNTENDNVLMMALKNNLTHDIINILLDKGCDTNLINDAGDTALFIACKQFDATLVKLLLNRGADVNIKNPMGKPALILASEMSRSDIVKLLIERGADTRVVWNGKIFIDYFYAATKLEFIRIMSIIEHQRLCKKQVLKIIKKYGQNLVNDPSSFRSKILYFRLKVNAGMTFALAKHKYLNMVDYYGIYDDDSMIKKVNNGAMYID